VSGLAARLSERPRDAQDVSLVLVDGARVTGTLHRTHGTRTLDFLNHQSEDFVALTNAMVHRDGDVERVNFIAINKAHIIRLIEA
jgi:uncharacterized protein DUF6812